MAEALLDYISSLQDQGIDGTSKPSIFELVEKWKTNNPDWNKSNEQPEEVEEVVEDEVNDEENISVETEQAETTDEASDAVDNEEGEISVGSPGLFSGFNYDNLSLSNIQEKILPQQQQAEYDAAMEKLSKVADPSEVISERGYDYKYEINNEGKIVYYTKQNGAEDFIPVKHGDKGYEEISGRVFKHFDFPTDQYNTANRLLEASSKSTNAYFKALDDNVKAIDGIETEIPEEFVEIAQQLDEAVSPTELQKTTNLADAASFVAKGPKIKETKQAGPRPNSKYTVEVENPGWKELQTQAINQYAKENDLEPEQVDMSDKDTLEKVNKIMTANKYSELIDEQEQRNLTNFIEDQGSDFSWNKLGMWLTTEMGLGAAVGMGGVNLDSDFVWSKTEVQKKAAEYQKWKKTNLGDKTKNLTLFINQAAAVDDILKETFGKIQNGQYTTTSQLAAANKELENIHKLRTKTLDLVREKYNELNINLKDNKEVEANLNKLERNYSLVPIITNNFENSLIEMGQGIEEIVFRAVNLPNELGPDAAQAYSIMNPVWGVVNATGLIGNWSNYRDKENEAIDKYQESIMGNIAEAGSFDDLETFGDYGRYIAAMSGSVLPQAAVMIGTGGYGLGAVVLSAGGSKFKQYEEEMQASKDAFAAWEKRKPRKRAAQSDEDYKASLSDWQSQRPQVIDYSTMQMWGGALTNMAIEGTAGYFISLPLARGKSLVGPLINRTRALNNPALKNGFSRYFTNIVKPTAIYAGDVLAEGGEEVIVGVGDKIYDRFALGKSVNIFEGWKDNLAGGIIGGNFFKAPGLFKPYLGAVQTPGDVIDIKGKQDQIKSLINSQIQNPKMSINTKNIIDNKIADLTLDINNNVVSSLNRYTNMSTEDISKLGNIEQKMFDVDSQIEQIESDPGIEVDKNKLLDDLKNERNNLTGQKNELLEPYVTTDAEGRVTGGNLLIAPIRKGAEAVAEQLGDTDIVRFDTTQDFIGGIETLRSEGVEVELAQDAQGNTLPAAEQSYGIIATLPDGTKQVIINNASQEADGVIPADKHEVLHAFAAKMDPEVKSKMGEDLYNLIVNDTGDITSRVEIDPRTKASLDTYRKDFLDGKISEPQFYEEVMAVVSDGLTQGTVKVKETGPIMNLVNKFLETIGFKQNFNDGKQVLDFLKDFNKDVLGGQGLSQQTLDRAGVNLDQEVDMGLETEVDLGVVQSKKLPEATEAYMDVPNNTLQQGLNSAIQNNTDQQFPIAQALVEKNWPLISKSLNINNQAEMDAAKEVVIDQILGQFEGSGQGKYGPRNTSALAGFSLEGGAQVSTYLAETIRTRKPEIDAAIADRTGGPGVQADQLGDVAVETETTEVAQTKPTPSQTTKYSDALLSNANTDKAGLETNITEAITTAYDGRTDVTLAETRNIPQEVAEVYATTFGLNPETIVDKRRNFSKKDADGLNAAKRFLLSNAQADFNRLPATVDASGKGTFIPKNVRDALYTDGKLTGTLKDYQDIIRIKPEKPIYRDRVGQTIRGLLNTHIRNRILETANPDSASRIASGAQFSQRPNIETKQGVDVIDDLIEQNREIGNRILRSRNEQELKARKKNIQDLETQNSADELRAMLKDAKGEAKQDIELAIQEKFKSLPQAVEDAGIDIITGEEVRKKNEIRRQKTINEIKPKDVADIMELRDIDKVKTKLKIKGDITVNPTNIKERQASMLETIKKGKIPAAVFKKLQLANFGRKKVYGNNDVKFDTKAKAEDVLGKENVTSYVVTTNGEFIDAKSDAGKINARTDWAATKGDLYYGATDPAYIEALKTAELNNDLYDSVEIDGKPYNLDDFNKVQRIKIPEGAKFNKNKKLPNGRTVAEQEKINMDALKFMNKVINDGVQAGTISMEDASLMISSAYQSSNGLIKIAIPFTAVSDKFEAAKGGKRKSKGEGFIEEHSPPVSSLGAAMLWGYKNNASDVIMDAIADNAVQVQLSNASDFLLDEAGLDAKIPEGTSILTPNIGYVRLAAAGINLNTITDFKTGKPIAEIMGLPLPKADWNNPSAVNYQNELLLKLAQDPDFTIKEAKTRLKKSLPVQQSKKVQADNFAKNIGPEIVTPEMTAEQQKTVMVNSLKTRVQASKRIPKPKGISIFDFDDTLAKTKEKVIVNMPDGSSKEISAAEFARDAGKLTEAGATFDFSNFENVANDTAEGPLADLARKRQGKFGSGDIFVLTARPNSAGPAIQQFLKSIGINIPLSNITGLADGSPQAKVDFVLNKTAEGYNDFYFADDSFANVKAVSQILDAIDVKNTVEQAQTKEVKLNNDINQIIEEVTGTKAFKNYSTVRARLEGKKKDGGILKRLGKQFIITASAEDFEGLTYALRGKGEQGNRHAKWINDNLIDPYNKAELELLSAKVNVGRDFAALRKKFPSLRGSKISLSNPLLAEIDGGPFNKEQAVRVYLWNKQGNEIPDMSQRDINRLVKAVEADPDLNIFADELQLIQRGPEYPPPGKNWLGGSIKNDILNSMDKSFRSELMAEWNENVDIIFSPENLNKLEAVYGSKYREALEDSIRRMKSGSNRPKITGSGARVVNEMLDWLNASVANVMFLNMRSGLLQSLSTVNFVNWGDNNIYNASKAFASKEMWPTFMRLMNSDYLINRRDGLKINVNEAELADAAKKGGIKGAFSYLMDKGFAITRVMDSFAIALGGAPFFINRKKALLNRVNPDTGKLYTEAEADTKAFEDFYAIAEETQQSSNPARISSQQASIAGRVLLSFQNVTMQMNRKTKKSVLDLYNRRKKPGMTQRESDLSNLSSAVYYVAMQNFIFNALQQGLFAMLFDEEEEDERKEERLSNTVNGMVDSLLFGLGFGGAIVATTKNILRRIADENTKDKPDYRDIPEDVFDVSSVLDAKFRKLMSSATTFTFNRKEIKRRGWSLDNPAYLAVAQIISAVTNAPIDRVLMKVNNLRQASDESVRMWQRVALVMGWSGWNFGLPYWGRQSTVDRETIEDEKLKEKHAKQVKEVKAKGFTKKIPLTGPNHYKPKGKLGVDYMQVERPDGTIQYYVKHKK